MSHTNKRCPKCDAYLYDDGTCPFEEIHDDSKAAPTREETVPAPARGSETREEARLKLWGRNDARLSKAKALLIEAYRDKDDNGIWFANALIAECERFKQKLEAAAPASQNDQTQAPRS